MQQQMSQQQNNEMMQQQNNQMVVRQNNQMAVHQAKNKNAEPTQVVAKAKQAQAKLIERMQAKKDNDAELIGTEIQTAEVKVEEAQDALEQEKNTFNLNIYNATNMLGLPKEVMKQLCQSADAWTSKEEVTSKVNCDYLFYI